MSVEEFEIGAELDRALRSSVTGLAQLIERRARRSADRDRTAASRAREEWLAQRDTARRQFLPWSTRPGTVEQAPAPDGARAWAAAAGWSSMDPTAQHAERELADRFRQAHGSHPSTVLPGAPGRATPPTGAVGELTIEQATELAEEHAPFFYGRHQRADEARVDLLQDWRHFATHGELPARSLWEEWAKHSGEGERFDPSQWLLPDGSVDDASRDAELIRLWDDGGEERGLRELEAHQQAMASAGMGDLRAAVGEPAEPTWARLMNEEAFAQAAPAEFTQAWRDARAAGAGGDIAAQAAAAQLAEQIRRTYGLDPNDYLLDAMTERAALEVEARRDAEDRARRATESATRGPAASDPAPVRVSPDGSSISRERVLELNSEAGRYFERNMRPGSAGHRYFVNRLGEDVAQGPWALGYAPPGWTHLTDHLRRRGVSDQEILDAGLGRLSSKGHVIDAFRDRAMVGIRNTDGSLVGFVGRDLSGDERAPKYLNTGTTAAFVKGEHIFGLSEAAPHAPLVRAEGPFDAMAITLASDGHVAGVAPLGTAMSRAQAHLLAEHADGRVWLANDSDPAGQAATEKDIYALADHGVETRVVQLPGGDPADLWQENPVLLRSALADLDQAPTAAAVVADHLIDSHRAQTTSVDGERQGLTETVTRVAETVDDPIERALILARLDDDNASKGVDAAQRAQRPVPDPRSATSYDRASEAQLDQLDDAAREARIASGHGFSQPTTATVRESRDKGPGPEPRPAPVPQLGPSPGRAPGRHR